MLSLLGGRWLQRLVVLSLLALLVNLSVSRTPTAPTAPIEAIHRPIAAAALQPASGIVPWPASAGLLVGEVVTRAAAASDQYVELYNASAVPASLAGIELVYVSASGATVTRKQAWTDVMLAPGQRLLLANAAGSFAGQADGLFSGGFSSAGGSLVLRFIGGAVIDSLSWGTAASAFVEGNPGPAPATGWSLERRPGGALGNWFDTNDNLVDSLLQPAPLAEGSWSTPTPTPVQPTNWPSAVPSTPEPTIDPDDPEPTIDPDDPEPTSEPDEPADPTPTNPEETGSPAPVSFPTPAPSTSASESPSPSPTASPSLSPTLSIAQVRLQPLASSAVVHGTLTTPTGLTESGRGAFVQDETAGIALYLASGDWPSLPVGSQVRAQGTLETRFSLLTLRLASATDLIVLGAAPPPLPLPSATGQVSETVEASLVRVEGAISDGISSLTDGFSTAIDDGTGPLRVIVAQATDIGREELPRGRSVVLIGVVGQRDSSGTGAAGYRLHLRSIEDVVPLASETPGPSASPGATPLPSNQPSPSASPTSQPSPSTSSVPSPTPQVSSIAAARQLAVGQRVSVRGVVSSPVGRLLGEQMTALQDATGGIMVKLPAGSPPDVVPGRVLEVTGVLAAPYGNLELRADANGLRVAEMASQPVARELTVAELGEQTEGMLARLSGTIRKVESSSSGSVTLTVEDASGQGRVFIFATLGLTRQDFSSGSRVAVSGIVGDRLGLYRLWPRSESDIAYLPTGGQQPPGNSPGPGSTNSPGPGSTNSPGGPGGGAPEPLIGIGEALKRQGQVVVVEGVVSAPNGLLDADPRRLTVQDSSGAVLVRLPADAVSSEVGRRLRLTGQVGTYYGAPQLTASLAVDLGKGSLGITSPGSAQLSESLEWRLVKVTGKVETVRRNGESWRAELRLNGGGLPIVGLARSGIPATALSAGAEATIVGIVRRAYPTASDQRLAVVPRTAADIDLRVVGAPEGAPGGPGGPAAAPTPNGVPSTEPPAQSAVAEAQGRPAVALAELARHDRELVRAGGLIVGRQGSRLLVRDDTASVHVRLSGGAEVMLPLLGQGLLLNAAGTVERTADGLELHVSDPALVAFIRPLPVAPARTSQAPLTPPAMVPAAQPPEEQPAAGRADLFWLLLLTGAGLSASVGVAIHRRPAWLSMAREGLRGLVRRLSAGPDVSGPI